MTMTPGKLGKFVLVVAAVFLWAISSAQVKAHWTLGAPTGAPKPGDIVHIDVKATVDAGWHVYGLVKADGPMPTTIEPTGGAKLAGPVTEDKPIKKLDTNFGVQVEYFEGTAVFHVPVKLGPNGLGDSLKVGYQTCNATTCIPPTTIDLPLSGKTAAAPSGPAASSAAGPTVVENVGQHGLFAFLLGAFVAGLAALITPCVFPMIPITVSFFTKRQETLGKRTGLVHAFAYCFGIISAFTSFGLIVTALFGASGLQKFATNPWVNGVLAVIFVLLALNLFGIFQINLPSSLQNRFSAQGRSGITAPFLMGLTFTLTSFTCTSAFVGNILVSAATEGYLYPALGMLAFSTAFSLPFLLLAIFPRYVSRLPRAGAWLEMVKGFMGFIEIAAAVKFISNVDLVVQTNFISRSTFLAIWAVVLLASVLFLVGRLKIGHIEVSRALGKGRIGFSAAIAVAALLFVVAAVTGRSLGELEAFLPPVPSAGWASNYQNALALAQRTSKPVLINFTGVTCTNCRWMESNMFPRDDVKQELKNYVLVELYTDRALPGDVANGNLEQHMAQTVSLPLYAAVAPDGKVRVIFPGSTRDSGAFVSFLKKGHQGS